MATIYYFDKKYDEVVRITRNINHPYAQAIYGLAKYELAETDDEVEKTFAYLKNIENDLCWKEEYQQTKHTQLLPVLAAIDLSVIYRVLHHDVDASYNALMLVVSNSLNEELRDDTKEDIATHYRKKLFGGYTYVK